MAGPTTIPGTMIEGWVQATTNRGRLARYRELYSRLQQLIERNLLMAFCSGRCMRRNHDRLRMVLKPTEEYGFLVVRKPALIEPDIERAHIGVHERALGIDSHRSIVIQDHLIE